MSASEPVSVPPTSNPIAALERYLRRLILAGSILYPAALTVLLLGFRFIGERFWPFALALYLPQPLFLLPLVVLLPAAFWAELKSWAYLPLLGCVIIFLWSSPWHLGFTARRRAGALRVITNNYGQNHGLSLKPFIDQEDPDYVALQDAANQARVFRPLFPRRAITQLGEFILISRGEQASGTLVKWPLWRGNPVAARFDLTWRGQPVSLYSVHLPTPRGDFAKLAGLGLLKELAGRNRRRSDNMSFQEAMSARVQLARDLGSVIAADPHPCVVVGDFNMPSNGYIHAQLAQTLQDSFAKAGRGFGFTFPADAGNPLTLRHPWLRLDYVFAGPGWEVDRCQVEPSRRSQHRAVVAELSRS